MCCEHSQFIYLKVYTPQRLTEFGLAFVAFTLFFNIFSCQFVIFQYGSVTWPVLLLNFFLDESRRLFEILWTFDRRDLHMRKLDHFLKGQSPWLFRKLGILGVVTPKSSKNIPKTMKLFWVFFEDFGVRSGQICQNVEKVSRFLRKKKMSNNTGHRRRKEGGYTASIQKSFNVIWKNWIYILKKSI